MARSVLAAVMLVALSGCLRLQRFSVPLRPDRQTPEDAPFAVEVDPQLHFSRVIDYAPAGNYWETTDGFTFRLTNKTDKLITIDWDRCTLVGPAGYSMRVIHRGTKYVAAAAVQPPSTIGPKARLSDLFVPAEAVELIDNRWQVRPFATADGDLFTLVFAYYTSDGQGVTAIPVRVVGLPTPAH